MKEDATTDISSPSAPAASSESENVRKGQTYANRFTSAQIPVTGQRDTATVKAGIKSLPDSSEQRLWCRSGGRWYLWFKYR